MSDKNDNGKMDDQQQSHANQSDREKHNPFKDTSAVTEETPEEDAEAEQQRKEALTERD